MRSASRWGTLLAGLSLAALLVAGCAKVGKAPAARPPGVKAAGDIARGSNVFQRAGCSSCHSTGSDTLVCPGLKGVMAWDTTLPNGKPRTDDNVKAWIRSGGVGRTGGTMPSNPGLTDRDLADLVAYLKTLK